MISSGNTGNVDAMTINAVAWNGNLQLARIRIEGFSGGSSNNYRVRTLDLQV